MGGGGGAGIISVGFVIIASFRCVSGGLYREDI